MLFQRLVMILPHFFDFMRPLVSPSANIKKCEATWTKKEPSGKWRLFTIISRASKWGTLKSAGNPRCAVHAEMHSIARPQPGPAAGGRVPPTSDTCQSVDVDILMNIHH